MIQNRKANGRDGKALGRKENLVIVNVLLIDKGKKWTRERKKSAAKSRDQTSAEKTIAATPGEKERDTERRDGKVHGQPTHIKIAFLNCY